MDPMQMLGPEGNLSKEELGIIDASFSKRDPDQPVHRFNGLGLLSWAHQDFADEALRRLGHERRNGRGDVVRLQLLFRILT
jgi:hypothetical protein